MIVNLCAAMVAGVVAGCQTTSQGLGSGIDVPGEFLAVNGVSVIALESEFISEVVGKPLQFLSDEIQADLKFNRNYTATGTIVRPDGVAQDMHLVWEWSGSAYCRTGTVGESVLSKKCETVDLYPGTGVLLKYIDSEDPDEYWIFK